MFRSEHTLDSLRAILKKITPGHDEISGFWFKKSMSILALQLSKCRQEATIPEWMTKRI